jgi:predicted RNase H-like HicB family nuclease
MSAPTSAPPGASTALITQDGPWWIGWIAEVSGVNGQEATREKLIESLTITLREALELARDEARQAAGGNVIEVEIAP